MKHAGSNALDALEGLLARLRALEGLTEKSRGVFYLKSRAFMHFHEDPAGLYVDIRSPGAQDFERSQANSEADWGRIVACAELALSRRRASIPKTQA